MVPRPKSNSPRRPDDWDRIGGLRYQGRDEVTFFLLLVTTTQGSNTDAAQKAAEAFVKQTKLDYTLDRVYRQHTSEEARRNLGNAAMAAKLAIEHQLFLRWEF